MEPFPPLYHSKVTSCPSLRSLLQSYTFSRHDTNRRENLIDYHLSLEHNGFGHRDLAIVYVHI